VTVAEHSLHRRRAQRQLKLLLGGDTRLKITEQAAQDRRVLKALDEHLRRAS
jgi:hypothetical protein